MVSYKKRHLFYLLLLLIGSSASSQHLSFKAAGDQQTGYYVDIYNGRQLIIADSEEFSLKLYNLDMSTEAHIDHWNGGSWTGNEKSITLKRNSYIEEFDANLSVTVNYEVVNPN